MTTCTPSAGWPALTALSLAIACILSGARGNAAQPDDLPTPTEAAKAAATPATNRLDIRLSWGHQARDLRPFRIGFDTHRVGVTDLRLDNSEPGDTLENGVCATRAGAGDVDAVLVRATWRSSPTQRREPQSIWKFLFEHGEAGQVARLKDDPGLDPDAPILTVMTAPNAAEGFSVGLDQLARHGAMWLPEHDVFVTLADAPVEFREHLASLGGERVLERIKQQPEATLAEWTENWADFGDPRQPNHGHETELLGARGHLTGFVARHGSIHKFGVDRWGSVRPDLSFAHKFRFDLLWPESRWTGQRIVDGLPFLITTLEEGSQRFEVEQFAAPLDPSPPARRGDVESVLFTSVRSTGAGEFKLGFRLATENTNRHPELRKIAGHSCVVDRETGGVWLMIETAPGLTLRARTSTGDAEDPRLEVDCEGRLSQGHTQVVVFKLTSPVLTGEDVSRLAKLDYAEAREETAAYWEAWLARGATFEAPEAQVNDLFRANLWHALVLPRHRTDGEGRDRIDLPYSNFAYGQYNADWPINQAVYVDYMIHGLRGYFDVAEAEFAAMFQTQQKEDGRVGGYADWGVYSPSMLYSIGQNFLLSRDRSSFERLLPASLRALDWCLAEVARGQSSSAAPGLIVAPLNDLTHEARAWAFPNAYFVAGMDAFGRALAAYGHPRAEATQAVAEKMRRDVSVAFARASVQSPVVQLADGTWNNYVPCDAMTPRRLLEQWYPADVDTGPLHLARLNAIDPRSWLTTAMLHDHEDNLFLDQWGMANEPVYNQQATAYLYRDEPEAAIRAFYSMIACAFSHHQLTPLEHRWAWGQYYMPPSTDGAWFELYRNMLLNDLHGDQTLLVGQAVPRAWLRDGQHVRVERAPTYFGPVNLHVASAAATGRITAHVEFASERRPQTLRVRLRHPEKRGLRAVTVNGAEWRDFDAGTEEVRIAHPTAARYTIAGHY